MGPRIVRALVVGSLLALTVGAYGGACRGWFLPAALDKPVSLKEGSHRTGHGGGILYFAGRSHYGGGWGAGK